MSILVISSSRYASAAQHYRGEHGPKIVTDPGKPWIVLGTGGMPKNAVTGNYRSGVNMSQTEPVSRRARPAHREGGGPPSRSAEGGHVLGTHAVPPPPPRGAAGQADAKQEQ